MIGWGNRPSKPGSLKEGEWNIGYGMAVGVFGAGRGAATVKATLDTEGVLVLECGVSDMGPGTATSMVAIVADNLLWPKEKIRFEMGDSSLPPGPMQGGSGTTSTLGSAVLKVCETLSKEMKTDRKSVV